MNRGSDGSKELVSKLEGQQGQVGQDQKAAQKFNGTEIGDNAQGRAVAGAKDISNQADAFNPAALMAQKGLTGKAAGMGMFYGGSADPTNTAKLQKFSNLYSMVAGPQMQRPTPVKPVEPGPVVKPPTHQDAIAAADKIHNSSRAERGDRISGVTPLDYLLKTGKIDLDTYYKAQNDSNLYGQVLKKNGYGS